jgi:hypothetical protein
MGNAHRLHSVGGTIEHEGANMETARRPWNGWYHVNGNTYGTWLRGDPKGWRARHHREHCEGDYRHPPPPGKYDHLYNLSRRLMEYDPCYLKAELRPVVGQPMLEMLRSLNIQPISFSVDSRHFHLLAKFPDTNVRGPLGRAKKHAYFRLREIGRPNKLWAKRARVLPVKDRQHQMNTYGYILDHAQKGAWTWTYRQGFYWVKDDGHSQPDKPQ